MPKIPDEESYAAPLFIDKTVIREGDDLFETRHQKTLVRKIPMMLPLTYRLLSGLEIRDLTERNEGPLDPGSEKVLIDQDKTATKTVYVLCRKDFECADKTRVRSCVDDSSRSASCLWDAVMARGGQVEAFVLGHFQGARRSAIPKCIIAILLDVKREIPVIIAFHTLGCTSDREILENIYDFDNKERMEMVKPTLDAAFVEQEQNAALNVVGVRGARLGVTKEKCFRATNIFVNGCGAGAERGHERLMNTLKKLQHQMDFLMSEVYNGQTGRQLVSQIFAGLTYYQLVQPVLYREPTKGRPRDARLNVGELEHDRDINCNNNNRPRGNRRRATARYNLRPRPEVDYSELNARGRAAADGSDSATRASRSRSQRTSAGRSRSGDTSQSRSRGRATRRRSSSRRQPRQEEEEEEEIEDAVVDDPDYTGIEVVQETQSTSLFTAADRAFYPVNFSDAEVLHAISNSRQVEPLGATGRAFDNVGGLSHIIDQVRNLIRFPFVVPDLYSNFQIRPKRGLLFHGPPGVGKTLVARALVQACGDYTNRKIAFFARKGSDILNPYVGQSEANLAKLFDAARQLSPSIIFIDEIDALAPTRTANANCHVETNVVSTLLALMDSIEDRGLIFVIGATNRLETLDAAIRRPGRFDVEIPFTLPNEAARLDILSRLTATWVIDPDVLDSVAVMTNGFSGAQLADVCNSAVFAALRRVAPNMFTDHYDPTARIITAGMRVELEDFADAIATIQQSLRCRGTN